MISKDVIDADIGFKWKAAGAVLKVDFSSGRSHPVQKLKGEWQTDSKLPNPSSLGERGRFFSEGWRRRSPQGLSASFPAESSISGFRGQFSTHMMQRGVCP